MVYLDVMKSHYLQQAERDPVFHLHLENASLPSVKIPL